MCVLSATPKEQGEGNLHQLSRQSTRAVKLYPSEIFPRDHEEDRMGWAIKGGERQGWCGLIEGFYCTRGKLRLSV